MRWVKLVAITAVGVALVVVAALLFLSRDKSPEDRAIEACREDIQQQLKSPTSAKFSGEIVDHGPTPNTWIVTGTLDAENSFGASIRMAYGCRLNDSDGEMVVEKSDVN